MGGSAGQSARRRLASRGDCLHMIRPRRRPSQARFHSTALPRGLRPFGKLRAGSGLSYAALSGLEFDRTRWQWHRPDSRSLHFARFRSASVGMTEVWFRVSPTGASLRSLDPSAALGAGSRGGCLYVGKADSSALPDMSEGRLAALDCRQSGEGVYHRCYRRVAWVLRPAKGAGLRMTSIIGRGLGGFGLSFSWKDAGQELSAPHEHTRRRTSGLEFDALRGGCFPLFVAASRRFAR